MLVAAAMTLPFSDLLPPLPLSDRPPHFWQVGMRTSTLCKSRFSNLKSTTGI